MPETMPMEVLQENINKMKARLEVEEKMNDILRRQIYENACEVKREFREKVRPTIRATIEACHDLIKKMDDAGDELEYPQCQFIKKFNTLSIKVMSHAYNKSLPEAKKYFQKTRELLDEFTEAYEEDKEGIEVMNNNIKGLLTLLMTVKKTCDADEDFKAHKERKHNKA